MVQSRRCDGGVTLKTVPGITNCDNLPRHAPLGIWPQRRLMAVAGCRTQVAQGVCFNLSAFGARVRAMNRNHSHRPLTTWALYFSVLFNVFSCGLGHGQALGFALIGISGVFCSLGGDTSTLQAEEGSALVTEELSSPFACPLCSASFFCLLFLFGVFWLLARANRRLINAEVRTEAPPRYCWPSANPRASPL